MCVHSLCDIVFHAVTHYEFDANLIRSGIIHERCERVPAIMGKMFHVDANDIVYQENAYRPGLKVNIYRHIVNFSQSLSGKVIARRVSEK